MYHIIINPASRSGRGLRIWNKQIKPALEARQVSFRPYFSENRGTRCASPEKSAPGLRIP